MLKNKLQNQFTINFDDDYKTLINKIAEYYQRKPAELLRLLLIPVLHNEYSKIMADQYPTNKTEFKKL